nr:Unknown Function [uncultured bacterium]AIA12950.1 Unknown Function [uncultured bacterium]
MMTDRIDDTSREHLYVPSLEAYAPVDLSDTNGYYIRAQHFIEEAIRRAHLTEVYRDKAADIGDVIHVAAMTSLNHRKDKAEAELYNFLLRELQVMQDNTLPVWQSGRQDDKHHSVLQRVQMGQTFSNLDRLIQIREDLRSIRTPEDYLAFFVGRPNWESLEIASLTHPLNWDASKPMMASVRAAIKSVLGSSAIFLDDDPRYDKGESMRISPTPATSSGIPHLTILSQKSLYAFHVIDEENSISFIKSESLIVDRDHIDNQYPELQEELRDVLTHLIGGTSARSDKERLLACIKAIEQIPKPLDRPALAQPTSTSIYVARTTKHADGIRRKLGLIV